MGGFPQGREYMPIQRREWPAIILADEVQLLEQVFLQRGLVLLKRCLK